MTLLSLMNDFVQFISSLFTVKTDFASSILSDTVMLHLTTTYYKIQFSVDCLYNLASNIYSSVFGSVSTISFNSIIVALKFVSLIALLIFIRGGIPRYRFDHLTKIGWIKYLSLVLASMLIQFLLLWMC